MSIEDEYVEPVRVEQEHRDDAVVVRVAGQVDTSTAPVLGDGLAAAFTAAARGGLPVVVDLTAVDFLASVGLSLLVQHHQIGERQGTPLRVVAPARNPLRALRATMLDEVLQLYASVPEALAATS
ncbi:STAS domain-containing protein [Umezawaea sp.]|uniref:STAS domain-containing protein n=1 Tax=Umezawaea sp. TaxID=1955258 RepID=UPI002ED4F14E